MSATGAAPYYRVMRGAAYHLFDTAVGRCAVVWREALIRRVLLPAASEEQILALIRRAEAKAVAGDPPPAIKATIDGIVALCSGKAHAFIGAPLDRAPRS